MSDDIISNVGMKLYRNLDDWPDCVVKGCKNKRCDALYSDKCHPHTLDQPKKVIKKLELVHTK